MQVFPPTKHKTSNPKRTGNCRYQPSRYDEFYSPIHLGCSFPPLPEDYQILYTPQLIRDCSGHSWRHAKCTMNLDEVASKTRC
jgi:hypothetical protein